MTRRALLLILSAVSIVASLVVLPASPAAAETEVLGFAQDGTFWRLQPRAPIVDVPCQAPIPADRCGQVAPTAGVVNAPNVIDGNMVVGHAGGPPGSDEGGGDQFWIVSQPDMSSVGPVDSVQRLTMTFTVAPDARGDFGNPVIKGCNIVVPFGVGEGSNPWDDRPQIDCSNARAPKIDGRVITFDVTDLAEGWIEGSGYGLAIVPGLPGQSAVVNDDSRRAELFPFQLSLINSNKADVNFNPVPGRAKAEIVFTPEAEEDDFGDDVGELGDDFSIDDFGTDETGLGDVGAFDTGDSDLSAGDVGGSAPSAGNQNALSSSPIAASSPPGFAWWLLLLLPIAALAIWGAGSALGPLGDPVPVRQGGVARLVARRQAEHNRP